MERKVLGQHLDVLYTALIVLCLDVFLYSYFSITYAGRNNASITVDVLLVLLAVLLGKKSARLMGFPVWLVKYDWQINKKQLLISILIGSCIIFFNSLILTSSDISNISWLAFSKFYQPFLLSLRAALSEELLYRFFIFSFIARLAERVFNSRAAGIIAGALVSSFLFGLLHQGFYLSFIFGAGLCYIYKNNGLMFAMGVHFFANLIPYIIIFLNS